MSTQNNLDHKSYSICIHDQLYHPKDLNISINVSINYISINVEHTSTCTEYFCISVTPLHPTLEMLTQLWTNCLVVSASGEHTYNTHRWPPLNRMWNFHEDSSFQHNHMYYLVIYYRVVVLVCIKMVSHKFCVGCQLRTIVTTNHILFVSKFEWNLMSMSETQFLQCQSELNSNFKTYFIRKIPDYGEFCI